MTEDELHRTTLILMIIVGGCIAADAANQLHADNDTFRNANPTAITQPKLSYWMKTANIAGALLGSTVFFGGIYAISKAAKK